jgi:hypothetical protein
MSSRCAIVASQIVRLTSVQSSRRDTLSATREIEVARYVLAIQRAERDGHRAPAPKAGLLTPEELRDLRVIIRRSNARAERVGG